MYLLPENPRTKRGKPKFSIPEPNSNLTTNLPGTAVKSVPSSMATLRLTNLLSIVAKSLRSWVSVIRPP